MTKKEKLNIKNKIINYAKQYKAKAITSSDENVLCFDLKGVRMPRDSFKDEVRAFIKVQMEFNNEQRDFNKNVSKRLNFIEEWMVDFNSWRQDFNSWRQDFDSWRQDIDSWRKDIDSWRQDFDKWRKSIDAWKKTFKK